MIAESVISFLKQSPLLKEGKLSADYLGSEPSAFSVEAVPSTTVLKEYSDGGSIRQFVFVLASREYFGEEVNLENSKFYEEFEAWLEKCTKEKNLPYLGEKMHSQSIEAQSGGYMYEGNGSTARYQVQCRLIYYKEA